MLLKMMMAECQGDAFSEDLHLLEGHVIKCHVLIQPLLLSLLRPIIEFL